MISAWWWLALAVAAAASGVLALVARRLRAELGELRRVTGRVRGTQAGVAGHRPEDPTVDS